MPSKTNLTQLLADLNPVLIEGEFVFLETDVDTVEAAETICTFQESEGKTFICTRSYADRLGYSYEGTFRQITLCVNSSLFAVGLLAAVSKALTEANIPCNVISAFHHDHVFVPSSLASKAIETLSAFSETAKPASGISIAGLGEKAYLIRPADAQDSAGIADLVEVLGYSSGVQAIKERVERISKSSADLLIVAVNPGRNVIGWLQAHSSAILESGFRIEIVGMIVSEKNRRRGIGNALVDEAARWAKRICAESIVVRSNVNRTESHGFYKSIGFTVTKTQNVYRRSV
jgi:GNAT superfamily N-acetyltransferase